MPAFGLIGKNLLHSFSKAYFNAKFKKEHLAGYTYESFNLSAINELPEFLNHHPLLAGFNVTIPYKQAIIPFLNYVDPVAAEVGAINTVTVSGSKKNENILKGFNTDIIGFDISLGEFIPDNNFRCLILGDGGASKAVKYVLKKRKIPFVQVSRNQNSPNQINYKDLDSEIIKNHNLIINTTPLGSFPEIEKYPEIPYSYLTPHHYLYDLVYNPADTSFMLKGISKGCKVKNGLQMLYCQADESFKIWQESLDLV